MDKALKLGIINLGYTLDILGIYLRNWNIHHSMIFKSIDKFFIE